MKLLWAFIAAAFADPDPADEVRNVVVTDEVRNVVVLARLRPKVMKFARPSAILPTTDPVFFTDNLSSFLSNFRLKFYRRLEVRKLVVMPGHGIRN